jgi:Trk K+ transport system NAD-binding subunit
MKSPAKLSIYVRYIRYLLWEFRRPLTVFVVLILLGGLVLMLGYDERPLGYAEACYAVFLQIFLESSLDTFPHEWYLQLMLFILPIVGLGAVAESVVRLAFLVFTQKRKLPEWQQMVASLYSQHFVVVGVGKVGLQIIKDLVKLREPVVVIEQLKDSPFLEEVYDLGVPVITGNGRRQKTLEQAGVGRARALILATDDDLANLDAAVTASDINPDIRVLVRLLDDTLAEKMAGSFGMAAISTSHVAAPAFVAAATGRKIYQEIKLGDQRLRLTDLTVHAGSWLAGRSVGEVQAARSVNFVMHRGARGVSVNPPHDLVLEAEDTLVVMAPMDKLLELGALNRCGNIEAR